MYWQWNWCVNIVSNYFPVRDVSVMSQVCSTLSFFSLLNTAPQCLDCFKILYSLYWVLKSMGVLCTAEVSWNNEFLQEEICSLKFWIENHEPKKEKLEHCSGWAIVAQCLLYLSYSHYSFSFTTMKMKLEVVSAYCLRWKCVMCTFSFIMDYHLFVSVL